MIISASRRTDIPAFYSEWFSNRLREGFVVTQNPFNANQKTKLRLDNSVVDAIVLWTKNPLPMMPRLDELDASGIPYYFQCTLTPYGKDEEPYLPEDKSILVEALKELSSRLGSDRVIWRYDPIFFSEKYSMDFHKRAFERCASLLESSVTRAVISFLDMDYNNTKAIEKIGIRDGSVAEKNEVAALMAEAASRHGMSLETCAEEIDLASCDIQHGRCIDADLIEKISGRRLKSKGKEKDKNQRMLCGCVASVDIGMYNTCKHGCAYCYANYSPNAIAGNCGRHNPQSPLLIGECDASLLEYKKDQKSYFETDTGFKQDTLF